MASKSLPNLRGVYINWGYTINNKPGEIIRFKIQSPTSDKVGEIDSKTIFDNMENNGGGFSLSKEGVTTLQYESDIHDDLPDDIRALRMAKQFIEMKIPATVPVYFHPKNSKRYFIDYSNMGEKK
jgi:hypothetical protein